jgi:glycosyltransferase involved in cell wall biosynthesis
MTTDTLGGVWNYAIDLCRFLSEEGVEVALATMGRPLSQSQIAESNLISGLKVFQGNYKLEWMENPWADVRKAGEWLLSLEAEFKPDVVHLNAYCFGALTWHAPTLMVCHSCVGSWWECVKGKTLPPEWEPYRMNVKHGLAASDLVVAPTESMLGQARRLYGPFKWSVMIPNGRDSRDYVPKAKEEFVLSAGRFWDEAKNLSALVEAAPKISWPIYIAGEAGSNPTPSVTNLGHLSSQELASWLAKAWIYALPARYEPFGLSILEAALSGCALVLGDIPSLRENWTGCAIFVDPNSPDEIWTDVQSLIRDEHLRRTLGKNAQAKGWTFGITRFGRTYLDLYEQLAQSPRRERLLGSGAVVGQSLCE